MRKKKFLGQIDALIAKNSELYNDNVALAKELENKKALIGELENKIALLESEVEEAKKLPENSAESETGNVVLIASEASTAEDNTVDDEVEPTVEEAVDENEAGDLGEANITETSVNTQNNAVIDSASAIIGKIVVECAELCNVFTSHGGPNAKDLVNLALGRTEVFKSEILQLVTEYDDFADAKDEVNLKVASIREYFSLLRKQL